MRGGVQGWGSWRVWDWIGVRLFVLGRRSVLRSLLVSYFSAVFFPTVSWCSRHSEPLGRFPREEWRAVVADPHTYRAPQPSRVAWAPSPQLRLDRRASVVLNCRGAGTA